MSTATVTPKAKQLVKSVLDLNTFEMVELFKDAPAPIAPVESVQDAIARVGNDTPKLLALITSALQAQENKIAKANPDGWLDEDGEAFDGTPADEKKVNSIVLTLAKLNGFEKGAEKDVKRAAKDTARTIIRNTPAIMDSLKKNAAASTDTDEE